MAGHLDPDEIENASKQLLEARMGAVRALVATRNHHTDVTAQLAQAEADDKKAYDTATAAGWNPDELRKIGLGPITTRTTKSGTGNRSQRRGTRTPRKPDDTPTPNDISSADTSSGVTAT